MKLLSPQKEIYEKERFSALQAQRLAQEIAFGPIGFQLSRLLIRWGIFPMVNEHNEGLTLEEITAKANISKYGAQTLFESSLTIGTVYVKAERFFLAKAGWFLLHDDMARVNMDRSEEAHV